MTTIRIEVEPPYFDHVMAQLRSLELGARGMIIIEPLEQMPPIGTKSDMDSVFEQVMRENDELNKRLS